MITLILCLKKNITKPSIIRSLGESGGVGARFSNTHFLRGGRSFLNFCLAPKKTT